MTGKLEPEPVLRPQPAQWAASTGIIIQARIGSTRLPGKVLMSLAGRSVLAHVIDRCRAVPGVDVVCCAIPVGVADDPVAEEAHRAGAAVFRGSEGDVLARYRDTATAHRLEVVMRVTADCPLIDPQVCAAVLALRAAAGADYAANNYPPTWPHGLDCEVMTMAVLDRAFRLAERPFQREHVTPWLRAHPGIARANLRMAGDSAAAHHRWTLDNPRDFAFLQAIFARLPAGAEGFGYRTVLRIVAAEPHLAALNDGQDRYEGLKRSMEEAA